MLHWLHDPRLKPLALSPLPTWLWSQDATRVLWANPTAAAIFGAATPAMLATRVFDSGQPAAAQVEHLANSLPDDGSALLEDLRGFGAGIGRTLACSCTRLQLGDGTAAILVAATERAGPDLSLNERATRLLAGAGEPVAVFAGDGTLIGATPAARRQLRDATSLASLGADALAAVGGPVAGNGAAGPFVIDRVGDESEPAFVVSFCADAAAGTVAPAIPVMPAARPEDAPPPAVARESGGHGPAPPAAPHQPALAAGERRHPLRFVWQIDAEDRFTINSDEFTALTGPRTAALLGQPWQAVAAALNLDPQGEIARAVATHDTWSGLTVAWPIDDGGALIGVELSGLPVFDRERVFRGYRGFGVCRDIGRINALMRARSGTAAPAAAVASPSLTVVPVDPSPADAPGLSPGERHAFYELSRRLTGRINEADATAADATAAPPAEAAVEPNAPAAPPERSGVYDDDPVINQEARPFLDRLPIGVLVYRLSHLLYANRAFLSWAGYDSLDALAEAGGLDSLTVEPGAIAIEEGGRKPFAITSPGDPGAVADARLLQVPWDGDAAYALLTLPPNAETAAKAQEAVERARAQAAELNAILNTATDGVIVLDRAARIVSANSSAQALFGYDAHELEGRPFSDLFTSDSIAVAADYLERVQGTGVASVLNDGREVVGRERKGGTIPLFMTMGRLGEGGDKNCAVFRDITQWKKAEDELIAAKREAERASSAKSDFLAKVSHEIRTPLNAIIGFSEVMMEERFGPVGNDRYRQYLKDIHASGGHLISLINDLLDLSKIEAGKLELTFAGVSINDLTQQCVAIMQPQANRERIIIRTSLSPKLPPVVADARSVRQIVLNLLSNSIKFTVAGGQVIVSTATTDAGEVVLRVRDTGIGMTEQDIATALEPFRQVATALRGRSGGTGLGLPLTKALAEANQAAFHIRSAPNAGTLVEITFPPTRVLAGAG